MTCTESLGQVVKGRFLNLQPEAVLHEQIVLTSNLLGDNGEELLKGDVGTVVHVHPGGNAFVVEFTALDGETVAIATVLHSQARPITSADLTHARILETSA